MLLNNKDLNIIVADDEENLRDFFDIFFERTFKIKITLFSNADEAWEFIQRNTVHMVISDVNMPGNLNGLDMHQEVKSKFPSVIYICISGEDNEVVAKKRKVDAYLEKPFSVHQLHETVKQFIQDEKK